MEGNGKTKGFMDIPAARFLKQDEEPPKEEPKQERTEGQGAEGNGANYQFRRGTLRRVMPEYGETRSRRRQILLKPSIDDQCAAIADRDEISFNQLAERAFTEYIERHGIKGE